MLLLLSDDPCAEPILEELVSVDGLGQREELLSLARYALHHPQMLEKLSSLSALGHLLHLGGGDAQLHSVERGYYSPRGRASDDRVLVHDPLTLVLPLEVEVEASILVERQREGEAHYCEVLGRFAHECIP